MGLLLLLNPMLAPAMNPLNPPMSLLLIRAKDFLNRPAFPSSRPPSWRRSIKDSPPATPLHAKVLLNPTILHSNSHSHALSRAKELLNLVPLTRSSGSRGNHSTPPPWEDYYLRAALAAGGSGAFAVYYFKHRETVPFTNRTRFVLFSTSFEGYLADKIFEKYNRETKSEILSPTHPDSVRAKRISNRIIHALQRRGIASYFPLKVVVVRDPNINACCLPGGKIIINKGLLDYMTNAEVASVIGHEVGHSIARHTAERLTKHLWMWLLTVILLAWILEIIKELFGVDIELPRKTDELVSTLLFELPLSRRMEKEADYIGLMLLASSGYDPREALNAMEKLGSSSEKKSSKLSSYVSTHPTSEERSKLLSQAMEEALAMYSTYGVGNGIEVS